MLRRLLLSMLLLAAALAAQIGNATWATAVPKNFQEPAWWDQGVVFVGNWEPLVFRLRHGGEIPVDIAERYLREHTEETVLKLKEAGVNMILTHFCETGLDSEKEDVELPKGLSALCHNHGLARPAALSPITDPLIQEWIDFRCQDLAEYYGKLAGYIRQLNPNVVVELNPHGISGANRAFLHGIDHVEGLQGLLEKADQWLRRLLRPPT